MSSDGGNSSAASWIKLAGTLGGLAVASIAFYHLRRANTDSVDDVDGNGDWSAGDRAKKSVTASDQRGTAAAAPTAPVAMTRDNTPTDGETAALRAVTPTMVYKLGGAALDFQKLPSQLEWADPVLGVYLQYPTEHIVLISEERSAPSLTLRFALRESPSVESAWITDMAVILEQVGPLRDDRPGVGELPPAVVTGSGLPSSAAAAAYQPHHHAESPLAQQLHASSPPAASASFQGPDLQPPGR